MKSWLITIAVADVLFTLALLGLAKRMHATRVASATLTFGLLFILLGGVTFGAMTQATEMLTSGLANDPATKAEITRAVELIMQWRDFIWHTQVIIGGALIAHWVAE